MPSLKARAIRRSGLAFVRAVNGSGEREPRVEDLPIMRDRFERLAGRQPVPAGVTVTEMDLGGVIGERVTSSRSHADRAILWLHGGAYVLCSPRTHRSMTTTAAKVARATVFVPEYRLSPEHPWPAALEDARQAWDFVTASYDPGRVAIMGDSAGGGLAMQLLVQLRDAGEELPGAVTLLSPWVDLSGSGPSMWERNEIDPWLPAEHMHLAAEAYAGDLALDDPHVSPLFADLHGLPPTLIHVGTDEIIHDDGVRLGERMRAAGCDASVGIWDGMWHVFQAFPVPESRRAWREIGGFLRRQIRDT